MTGSMYAAVSGLKAHMSALNVIGNNVSNVNTTGYKTTRYTFNEALYTTQRNGSNGTDIAGGRNPAQVGFGASIGTIDLDMSTKNYTPTGKLLDTMIDGDGFFFVGDKTVGNDATAVEVGDSTALKGMNLTRLGNFDIDPNGYLVDGNGSVVWGFLEEAVDEEQMIDVDNGSFAEAGASSGGNVKKLTDLTQEDVETLKKNGLELHNVKYTIAEGTDPGTRVQKVESATHTVSEVMSAIRLPMGDADKKPEWPQFVEKHYVDREGNPLTVTAGQALPEGAIEVPVSMTDATGEGLTRLESDSTTIDEKSGALRIMTSEGEIYTVGYIAIGKVTNPNGVTHVDGRYYQAQDGAGTLRATSIKGAVKGVDSAGDTKLITGGLESSGTDLATEITNMITVQRGYQANTRIVTVTDSMLEELVNMKR